MTKKTSTRKTSPTARWFFDFDYDGAAYVVPVRYANQWHAWLSVANCYPAPKAPSFARKVSGSMSSVTFASPRQGKDMSI